MTDTLKTYASVPLRLMAAVGFLYHGLPKFTPEGHQMFVGMLEGIRVPAPELASWLVGVVEVAGGLLLLMGYRVRLVVLPLIADMLVAMFTVHWPNGFNVINMTGMGPAGPTFGMPGIELSLLYLSILSALWLTGAGRFSLDARREQPGMFPHEPALGASAEARRPPSGK